MNYIDILLPIGLILFGGLFAYLIGFVIGRRSAYSDVNQNFKLTNQMGLAKKSAGTKGLFHTQIIK